MANFMEKNYPERDKRLGLCEFGDRGIPHMTHHALQRTAQRSISEEAILATLHYGKKVHRTGRVFFILRKKDVASMPELESFAGTTLLLGRDGTIITAYSNQKAYRVIKKKSKRRRRR